MRRPNIGREESPWSINKAYGNDWDYMSLDHKYDHLWGDISKATNAIIVMDPKGEEPPELGSIGMFHQLHCLASFRMALQRAKAGDDIGMDHLDNKHWPHCFYYLRQAILCSADNTIEFPSINNGSKSHFISGTNDIRKCRSSESLYDLQNERGLIQHWNITENWEEKIAAQSLERLQGNENRTLLN